MFRNILILLVFVSFGFVANMAQGDIFVRKTTKQQDVSKDDSSGQSSGTIYLRSNSDEKEEDRRRYNPAGRVDYNSRVTITKRERQQMTASMKALAYWERRGTKPRNAKELRSHAIAYTAQNRAAMLKSRYAMQAKVSALQSKRASDFRQKQLAETPNIEAVIAADEKIAAYQQKGSAGGNVYTSYGTAQKESPKKTRVIYRRPDNSIQKPTKVFRDYR